MKNLVLTILLSINLLPVVSQSQTFKSPDYDTIKKVVQDTSSPNFYPKLMARFLSLDSSLTSDDYTNLFYGYVFQKDYKPYERIPEEQEFRSYISRLGNITPVELDRMIELGTTCRKKFPFNTDVAKYLWMAYQKKNDFSTGMKLSVQSYHILKVIKSSGDGKTPETAFHVLTVGNEYELLRSLFFKVESQSLIGRNYDYIKLEPNESNIDGLYFNIEKIRDTQR